MLLRINVTESYSLRCPVLNSLLLKFCFKSFQGPIFPLFKFSSKLSSITLKSAEHEDTFKTSKIKSTDYQKSNQNDIISEWSDGKKSFSCDYKQVGPLHLEIIPKGNLSDIENTFSDYVTPSIKDALSRLLNINNYDLPQVLMMEYLNNYSNDYVILAPSGINMIIGSFVPLLMKFEKAESSKYSNYSHNTRFKPLLKAYENNEHFNFSNGKVHFDTSKRLTSRLFSIIISPSNEHVNLAAQTLQSLSRYISPEFRSCVLSHNYNLENAVENLLQLRPNVIVSTPTRLISASERYPEFKKFISHCEFLIFHKIRHILTIPHGDQQIALIKSYIYSDYRILYFDSLMDNASKISLSKVIRLQTTFLNLNHLSKASQDLNSKSDKHNKLLAILWGPKSSHKFLDSLGIAIPNNPYGQPRNSDPPKSHTSKFYSQNDNIIKFSEQAIEKINKSTIVEYIAHSDSNLMIPDYPNPSENSKINKILHKNSPTQIPLVSSKNKIIHILIPPNRLMPCIYNCMKNYLSTPLEIKNRMILIFPTIRCLQFFYVFFKHFFISSPYLEKKEIELWSNTDFLALHSHLCKDKRIGIIERFNSSRNSILFTTDLISSAWDFIEASCIIQLGPQKNSHGILSDLSGKMSCSRHLILTDLDGHFLYELAMQGIDTQHILSPDAFKLLSLEPELVRFYKSHFNLDDSPNDTASSVSKLFKEGNFPTKIEKWFEDECLDASFQLMYRSLLGHYSQMSTRLKFEKWRVCSFVNEIVNSFGKTDIPFVSKQFAARLGIIDSPGLNIDYYADSRSKLISSLPSYPGFQSKSKQTSMVLKDI